MGTAELTVERFDEPDYMHEELVVEIALDDQFKSSELGWAATTRVLIAINPPETGWDAAGDIYSTLSEIGDTEARVFQLQASCDLGELAQSRTNEIAHYCHRGNLSDATINGKGVRSLCGVYFVPTRDHQALPVCETCEQLYNQLP
ncbi:DUF3039 domain-containing protein [Humibacter albus]|uniref:DUF3039 domain-containing protein n=1 Tax=Humibacter albus TaxID=427754 RepID=UPI0003B39438|nr:DUF3039 domain-containing protein [Humibacter albus]